MGDSKKYIYITRVPDQGDYLQLASDYDNAIREKRSKNVDLKDLDPLGKIYRGIMIWFTKVFFFYRGNAYQYYHEEKRFANIGKEDEITNDKLSTMVADYMNVLTYLYHGGISMEREEFKKTFDELLLVKASRYYKLIQPSVIRKYKYLLEHKSNDIKSPPSYQIHFKNGFWDVHSRKFSERRGQTTDYQQLTVLNAHRYNYVNPSKECVQKWKDFLLKIIPDSDSLLWLLSYCADALIGDTCTQDCLVLIGEGSNGKSTFMNMMKELFHGYWTGLHPSVLEKNGSGHRLSNAIRNLPLDTKFVFIEELTAGKQSGNSIKLLTESTYHIPAHYKNEATEYKINFKIMATSNGILRYPDLDGGLMRRLRFAYFPNKFVDNPELVDNKSIFLRQSSIGGDKGSILKTDEDKTAVLKLLMAAKQKVENRANNFPSLIETMAEQLSWQKMAETYLEPSNVKYISEASMYKLVCEHFPTFRYSAVEVKRNLLELKLPFAVTHSPRTKCFWGVTFKKQYADKFIVDEPDETINEQPDTLRELIDSARQQQQPEHYLLEPKTVDVDVDDLLNDLPPPKKKRLEETAEEPLIGHNLPDSVVDNAAVSTSSSSEQHIDRRIRSHRAYDFNPDQVEAFKKVCEYFNDQKDEYDMSEDSDNIFETEGSNEDAMETK